MTAEVIVGGAVGAVTLYLWGWRRFKYVRARWQHHQRADEFERALREAREDMTGDNPFRAPGDADGELVALLVASAGDQRALVEHGFKPLGDMVVQIAERPATAALRAFVDEAGTTCAVVGVTRRAPEIATLTFSSYAGDEVFATRRGKQRSLAEPPTMHRQALDLPPDQLLARHRTFARLDGAARIATRDELIAQLAKARANAARWRDVQPPDELLDADLRAVLGDLYPKVGKAWARRLRGKLPQATLRRAS